MVQDTIGNWVKQAKASGDDATGGSSSIRVIRRPTTMTKGQLIMAIADRMFPRLMNYFKDKRDQSGMLLQPAHVRGIALNIAQDLIKNRELQEKKSY